MTDKKVYLVIAIIAIAAISVAAYLLLTGETEPETPNTIAVTVTSSPTGAGYVKVDGTAITTPKTFQWEEGSTHTLEATSTATWVSWSDGGSQTHEYTVPASDATITAAFEGQIKVTFDQSGLDTTADEAIVSFTVNGETQTKSYADLPVSTWVDAGTQVSYTIEANVSTTCPGAYFMLTNSESSTTITVDDDTTVTAEYKRTIIDANGGIIDVPDPSTIERIADSWPAHNTIVVMCGYRDALVATATTNTVNPMFQKILPAIETMLTPFNSDGTVNVEELMAENPDIVFVSASGEEAAAAMENSGMTVVRLQFYNFEDMVHTVRLTGWILGEEAFTKALNYVDYFTEVQDNIISTTADLTSSEKIKVLHLVGNSLDPIRIDAGTGLINTWINLCGGDNAAAEIDGNMQTVSLEQILAWNPDLILIGSATANDVRETILNDELWSELDAVKNGKVMANPMGVFDWARYSVEEALNIQWVSHTLYPDLFPDTDIRAETAYFYETYYEYTLSEAEITDILRQVD
ncbi:MAG: ABC transporter substrate-binding protein [Candidatus Bathyarchaeota archaeon]|nr:ABC transporter substrate-binding protein [Candidatus Bathyarchaeota archaeon]